MGIWQKLTKGRLQCHLCLRYSTLPCFCQDIPSVQNVKVITRWITAGAVLISHCWHDNYTKFNAMTTRDCYWWHSVQLSTWMPLVPLSLTLNVNAAGATQSDSPHECYWCHSVVPLLAVSERHHSDHWADRPIPQLAVFQPTNPILPPRTWSQWWFLCNLLSLITHTSATCPMTSPSPSPSPALRFYKHFSNHQPMPHRHQSAKTLFLCGLSTMVTWCHVRQHGRPSGR